MEFQFKRAAKTERDVAGVKGIKKRRKKRSKKRAKRERKREEQLVQTNCELF